MAADAMVSSYFARVMLDTEFRSKKPQRIRRGFFFFLELHMVALLFKQI